ncbi:hypothetical protein ACLWNE_00695 [Thermus oshimai]|uniref:hypothetical protein n=1 Tax=Thermus oshimai TaxID=56957 RepID=UPI0039A56CB4
MGLHQEAMAWAPYEPLQDEEPYHGETPGLPPSGMRREPPGGPGRLGPPTCSPGRAPTGLLAGLTEEEWQD